VAISNPVSEAKTEPQASVFNLVGTPLLSSGMTDSVVARSDNLVGRVKVYAEGGENALHCHAHEEHVFLVLAGQATFYLGREERPHVVEKFQGVHLPRGAFYRFHSTGDENLVMFRVGTGKPAGDDRMGPHGRPLPGHSPENKTTPGVVVPGKVFAP
jgi:mannose-6-phosphate isomerase-like protein (cupin superfamily)